MDEESGPRQCGFDCNLGFIVPNALTNTCVLEDSSPGMAQCWDGTFVRGCQSCSDEELSTQFEMEVAPFEIDLTEVTVEAYRICVTSGDCERPADGGTYADTGSHQLPVTNVTQVQAAEYCKLQGKRLPTEAEWEAAARVSGADESRVISDFPWGDSPEPDCYNSVLANNDQACPRGAPVEVGSSPRGHSLYGVADLSGNVREWVFDRYLADTYSVNVQDRGAYGGDNNATLTEAVIRGGSYLTPNYPNAYGWYRTGASRTNRAIDVGFRCAKLKSSRDNGQECIADVDCTSQNCSISDGVTRGICQSN
jgi:formylglycine-generating enzyme required for sulfatase activity